MFIRILLWLLTFCAVCRINAQHANEVFGKNKIQYNSDQQDWWLYETNNFIIYWYGKSRNIAQFCISLVEQENHNAQKIFEYHLKDKIELIIYSDLSDLAQTNIDLKINDKNRYIEPRVIDQKVLLAFNGNHQDLLKQLQLGIIHIYLNSMFSGSNIQEAVQKVISLKLPEWYTEGLLEFLAQSWTTKQNTTFFEEWNPEWSFKKFTNRNAKLAGHSFWNFLTVIYGKQSISNWLYMTRIQKDVNRAARLVFNKPIQELEKQWHSFYKKELLNFNRTNNVSDIPISKFKLKQDEVLLSMQPSMVSGNTVLTTQRLGQTKIRILDINTGKIKTIFKKGFPSHLLSSAMNFPLYSEADDHQFALIEKKDRLILYYKKLREKKWVKSVIPREIQQAYSMQALNKDNILLSGNRNGFSDLMIFNIPKRQFKLLSEDIWDDLKIKNVSVNDTMYSFFLSNRPEPNSKIQQMDSTLPIGPFKIYQIAKEDLNLKAKPALVTSAQGLISWDVNPEAIICLEESAEATKVRYKTHHKEEYILQDNVSYSHICFDKSNRHFLAIEKRKKKHYIYRQSINIESPQLQKEGPTPVIDKKENYTVRKFKNTSIDTGFFISSLGNPKNLEEILAEFNDKRIVIKSPQPYNNMGSNPTNSITATPFISSQAIAYRDRYSIAEISSEIQNNLLFDGLNTFAGSDGNFDLPPLGVLFKGRAQEIFQNVNIEAGIRIPTIFNGTETYLLIEDLKRRIDHKYAIYRKATKESIPTRTISDLKFARRTLLFNHQMTYAFSHYLSARLNTTIRNDHNYYLVTNRATLEDSANFYQQRIGSRIELVLDNALDRSVNIRSGCQAKLFFEFAKRFEFNPSNNYKWSFSDNNLYLLGVDARYHHQVLKKSVWSTRVFSLVNFGSDRILYHIGGTENWLLPKHNQENFFQPNQNYIYNGLATEVRGYELGTRKSGSLFIFSTELRVPFLQYLLSQNWKNNFLRNLQVVTFFDLAYTWEGIIPSFNNFQNVQYRVQNKKLDIDLKFSRDPSFAGTGIGLRTSVFGYFIRFDYAWKISNNKLQNPLYHLSLGLDF